MKKKTTKKSDKLDAKTIKKYIPNQDNKDVDDAESVFIVDEQKAVFDDELLQDDIPVDTSEVPVSEKNEDEKSTTPDEEEINQSDFVTPLEESERVSVDDFEAEFENIEDENLELEQRQAFQLDKEMILRCMMIFLGLIIFFSLLSVAILTSQLYNFKLPGFIVKLFELVNAI